MKVAIDGPSGSGKSTISKLVAKRLNFIYIDTGALYRTIAYGAQKNSISWDNALKLGKYAEIAKINFKQEEGVNKVFLNGEDVTSEIRTPKISMGASKVSAYSEVRNALIEIQRSLGNSNNSVLEGRDIGTVIFPDADIKIFLTASNEVRAERRYKELKEKNVDVTFDIVLDELIQRDMQDTSRQTAPLKKASDAIEIDCSTMTIEEVVSQIINLISERK
jgi:cytidylate kinase